MVHRVCINTDFEAGQMLRTIFRIEKDRLPEGYRYSTRAVYEY